MGQTYILNTIAIEVKHPFVIVQQVQRRETYFAIKLPIVDESRIEHNQSLGASKKHRTTIEKA